MKFLDYVEKASQIEDDKQKKKINIAILRSYTCENIEPILKVELFEKGFLANVEFGIYNQYYQEAIDEQSFIYQKDIDIVIMLVRAQDMFAKLYENSDNCILDSNIVENIIKNIKEKSKVKAILFLNMDEYEQEVNGILEYNSRNSITSKLKEFNLKLIELRENYSNLYLIDINKLIRNIGITNTFNNKMKYLSKDPYKIDFYIELAKKMVRVINRIYNPNKKVLILDLDNTLYKGILSEDGINSIINFEEYPNAHYKELQIKIKNLKNRGILICLATKNDYSDVEKLFNKSKMPLLLSDFTIIKANWEDKYKNIIEISKELNLDLSSFVFVDDNPYEIEMVNKMLPQVETINISTKPEEAEKALDEIGFFETFNITEEDKKRAELYSQRLKVKFDETIDLDTFLKDLQMQVEFKILNEDDNDLIERASQMTLKTNQFNMTTRRYDVQEIKNILKNSRNTIGMMFVEDKFGDNGSTGLFILKDNVLDSFLLSCRVLKRKLEFTMLNFAKNIVKNKLKKNEIIAEYIETEKNKIFGDFYSKAGMTNIENNLYKIDVKSDIQNLPDYINEKTDFYTIYGQVDKIRNLRLVQTGEKFELMNDNQIYELAEKIVSEIKNSNYQKIVVSESGASPLVNICSQIAAERKIELEWFPFKTPRQNDISLYEMIKFYLSKEEQTEERMQALKQYCQNIDITKYLPLEKLEIKDVLKNINQKIDVLESLDDILKGTKLYEIFSSPFLFFDEYVLSGTILRNFNFYANLICKNVDYKIGAYMVITDNLKEYENIAFSIYSLEKELEAYRNGAYPFEDRIDLIGYIYKITNTDYKKIYIKDFIKSCDNKETELNEFINDIYKFIDDNKILELIKQKCKKEDLKDYFNKEDIVRYIFKMLEQNVSNESDEMIFIDECFELYSPIWIPMPKEYHYEYWKTFVRLQFTIDEFINAKQEKYNEIREYFICKLAKTFEVNNFN